MNIHVVHSFKGGCGKTTVALTLAAELGHKNPNNHRKVILLDMDLKGSGLEATLRQGPLKDATTGRLMWESKQYYDPANGTVKIEESKNYITDYFTSWITNHKSVSLDEFIESIQAPTFTFDIAMANMDQASKRLLYIGNESGGVELDFFKHLFRSLLQLLEGRNYTDVVLDMPAGSDEYVEEMNRILFPPHLERKGNHCYLYYVTTTDTSNLVAAGNYLNYLFFRQNLSMERSLPTCTVLVLNDVRSRIHDIFDMKIESTEMFYKELQKPDQDYALVWSLFEILYKKINEGACNRRRYDPFDCIRFTFMPYNENFQKEMSSFLMSNDTFLSLEAANNEPKPEDSNPDDSFVLSALELSIYEPVESKSQEDHIMLKNYVRLMPKS